MSSRLARLALDVDVLCSSEAFGGSPEHLLTQVRFAWLPFPFSLPYMAALYPLDRRATLERLQVGSESPEAVHESDRAGKGWFGKYKEAAFR